MSRLVSLVVVGALLATAGAASAAKQPPRRTVTVMTRNLYLGASLDPILHATSTSAAFKAVEEAWAQVQANDFPQRARAIAAEIARAKPDVVGFQELSLYQTQSPADFKQSPATHVVLDYKRELEQALKARKLPYRFVGVNVNTEAELPSGDPPQMDVRLTVRNALLVRNGVRFGHVRAANYPTSYPIFGGLVVARRGWVSADLQLRGRSFRVITTHLEAFDRGTQEQQSKELLAATAGASLPTVLLGDLNSRPDGSTTASYANLVAGGFHDAWREAYPGKAGLTCCHDDDLRDPGGPFYERIDDVLTRGGFRGVRGAVVGEAPRSRTAGGLWPSDHGGLWMTLRLP